MAIQREEAYEGGSTITTHRYDTAIVKTVDTHVSFIGAEDLGRTRCT